MSSKVYLGFPPQKVVSWCEKNYGKHYLTFEPLSSETAGADLTHVLLRNDASTSLTGSFEAKLNDGEWTTISWEHVSHGIDYNLVQACDPSKETIAYGEKLQIRGLDKWNDSSSGYRKLKVISDAGVKVSGKLAESLTPEFAADTATECKLASFFKGSTGLKDASGLDLDGIALASYCYLSMFSSCTSLVNAPELPATTLADWCYLSMFYNCTSLVNAPALPATTLATNCYSGVFEKCTSLVNAPELPATTLAYECYRYMFSSCTSLVNAPALPATTLASRCYYNMFNKCTSLVNAPELPATTLAGSCYTNMFNGCTKIAELHYPASIESDSTFTSIPGSPWFGATKATVHYNL